MKVTKRVVGGAALLLSAIGSAHAGCADATWQPRANPAGEFQPAVYWPATGRGEFLRTNDGEENASIVGLWKFEMLAKSTPQNKNPMPDNTVVDFGTAVWHADGTELQTSGIRNPSDGDVCQGVWTQVGPNTFQLNHYALAWTNGAYTGPVNIRAVVKVDPTKRHFAGLFQTNVYLASTTAGHEFDQNTKLVTITGTFTGNRVTIND
jgi:hypothetical protein